MKWLCAQVFYVEEEFWALYDREWFDALRQKYNAPSLLSMYEKARRTVPETSGIKKAPFCVRLLGGLYGVWRSPIGGDYLVTRERSGLR
jgi:delta24-sterol reductase